MSDSGAASLASTETSTAGAASGVAVTPSPSHEASAANNSVRPGARSVKR
jgi:hypothetical protein